MDSDTRQHIFDPFFTTKDIGQGTGLGLATVYGIVQQCLGAIRVNTELNCGSTFNVYVPLSEPPLSMRANHSVAEAALSTSVRPDATTVLLVEDEPTVLRVARRILKRQGYRVLAADGAEHALTVSNRHAGTIDILITDVMMAEIEGPSLARMLRVKRPNLRTLYVSGYSRDQSILQEELALGAMFLAKPFTDELLIAKTIELMATMPPAT